MYYINLRHQQTNEILSLSFKTRYEIKLFIQGWDVSQTGKHVERVPNTKWAIRIDGTLEYFPLQEHLEIILHGYTLEPDYDIENILTSSHRRILYETVSERSQESTH